MKHLSKYQHPEGTLEDKYRGKTRSNKRFRMINKWGIFKNHTVLDLGCNNGELVMRAKKAGASWAVGVDSTDCIFGARELAKERGIDAKFWQMDVESKEFKRFCPKFDFVFCCSLLTHLKDPGAFLEWLDPRVRRILFFESNAGAKHKNQIDMVKDRMGFTNYIYVGESEDKKIAEHHLWKCYKHYESIKYPSWENVPVSFIPISSIHGWDNDHLLDKAKVEVLRKNIKKYGIRTPLIVRRLSVRRPVHLKLMDKGKFFNCIQGHHRYLAAKALGYKSLPVKIVK